MVEVVEEFTNNPDLTTDDLNVVLDLSDATPIEDTSVQTDLTEVLNKACLTALDNSEEPVYSYSTPTVEVYLERGSAEDFADKKLTTDSGSGV